MTAPSAASRKDFGVREMHVSKRILCATGDFSKTISRTQALWPFRQEAPSLRSAGYPSPWIAQSEAAPSDRNRCGVGVCVLTYPR